MRKRDLYRVYDEDELDASCGLQEAPTRLSIETPRAPIPSGEQEALGRARRPRVVAVPMLLLAAAGVGGGAVMAELARDAGTYHRPLRRRPELPPFGTPVAARPPVFTERRAVRHEAFRSRRRPSSRRLVTHVGHEAQPESDPQIAPGRQPSREFGFEQ